LQEELPSLETIEIPRLSGSHNQQSLKLHSFADAAELTYAAVIYPQAEEEDGKLWFAAKTKVAPIKQVSLPRLELCAAAVLVQLVAYLREALKLLSPQYTPDWTQPVTLCLIQGHPTKPS